MISVEQQRRWRRARRFWFCVGFVAQTISLAALLLLWLYAPPAHAYGEVPSVSVRNYSYNCGGTSTITRTTAAAVAAACGAARTASFSMYGNCELTQTDTWTYTVASENATGFQLTSKKVSTWVNRAGSSCTPPVPVTVNFSADGGSISAPIVSCPGDSTGSGSKCFCNAAFRAGTSGSCEPIGDCAGQAQAAADYVEATGKSLGIGAGAGTRFCNGGCTIQSSAVATMSNGERFAFGPFSATGGNCKGGEGSGDSWAEPPIACGANKCPGTVNGQAVCVACSVSQSTGSAAASSPGSGSSGSSSSLDGVPGASSRDSTVECDGTTCTTTTTYRDAAGNVVQTKTDTKDQPSFCHDNPGLQICKNSTISASCQTFSCDGDAVQCAIAQRVWADSCEWSKGEELQGKGFDAVAAGTRPPGHPANSGEVIGMSDAISTVDLLGGAGCPTDVSVTVASATVVIPWSKACEPLQLLGNLAVAVSMLGAMFIVFRN